MVALAEWIQQDDAASEEGSFFASSRPSEADTLTKNRVGDFFGENRDRVWKIEPQVVELHLVVLVVVEYDASACYKYLYAHGNPVMRKDPSGRFSITSLAAAASIGAIVNGSATVALNFSSYRGREFDEIAAEIGESALIGLLAGVTGGAVGARLALKVTWPALRGALAGLAAGATGQFLSELVDYAFQRKDFTFEHACGSGIRVVTASFGGFVTGGLLSKLQVFKVLEKKHPILTTFSTYAEVVDLPGATGVAGGSLLESLVRASIGVEEWICE